jgi:hypothetical protein
MDRPICVISAKLGRNVEYLNIPDPVLERCSFRLPNRVGWARRQFGAAKGAGGACTCRF